MKLSIDARIGTWGVAVVYLGKHVHLKTPAAIPEELIINGATELGPTLQPVASDPFLLDETLVILRKFSLVRRNASTNTLSMHRLVQAVLQDSMSEKTRRLWAERTVRAERFYLDALTIWQQMPKPQHPLMCTSLHGLAQLSIARGKYAQAEVYLHQERAHLEQTMPPLHPALAHNLNDWALLALAQGKYKQVEPLLRQLLKILELSIDLGHPFAGCTLNMLGVEF